jgi:phosphoribosylamine--glycine ligase
MSHRGMSTAGAIRQVCVVGSGGREHALATVIGRTADVVVLPGNPGIAGRTPEGHVLESADGSADDAAAIEATGAELVVIGPEAPLVDGLADRLRAGGRLVFGPGAAGARLEGSKAFMKEVVDAAGIPTARFGVFEEPGPAISFLRELPGPWAIKTDGLAAGKGVLVTSSPAEAEADIVAKLSGQAFGDAGRRLVVEEGLVGVECSLLVLCDGSRIAPLAPAQDFKRVGDGDTGPNTGGMGAYSPVPFVDDTRVADLADVTVAPLVAELRRRGIDYRGVLYAGLMLTPSGPRVLEFNVRFGDPETQVVLPRFAGDLTAVLAEVAAGDLRSVPTVTDQAAVCVVMAAAGYPGPPRRNDPITGIGQADALEGVSVFHAGTAHAGPGPDGTGAPEGGGLVTAGGRVLGVTGLGPSLAEARRRAYAGVEAIRWDGAQHRTDIALAATESSTTTATANASTASASEVATAAGS